MTEIRHERWQWENIMPLFWLHWLHAPSLVSIGQSKLKLLSGNWISIFNNSDLDHRHLGSNPKLRLDVSYQYIRFGVNRPKQIKVIERKMNFYFLVTVTLTLITNTLAAIPSCVLMSATHTPSSVSKDQNKLKLLSKNWISIFSNSDFDLDHRHLGSNPKLCLDVSYQYSKFGVNRPK